jgi:hypothetical protein
MSWKVNPYESRVIKLKEYRNHTVGWADMRRFQKTMLRNVHCARARSQHHARAGQCTMELKETIIDKCIFSLRNMLCQKKEERTVEF